MYGRACGEGAVLGRSTRGLLCGGKNRRSLCPLTAKLSSIPHVTNSPNFHWRRSGRIKSAADSTRAAQPRCHHHLSGVGRFTVLLFCFWHGNSTINCCGNCCARASACSSSQECIKNPLMTSHRKANPLVAVGSPGLRRIACFTTGHGTQYCDYALYLL
jgi:hypothetical protein